MAGKGRATYEITVDTKGAQADLDGLVRGGAQKFEKLSGAINAATGQLGGLGGVAGKTLATFKQMGEAFLVTGPIGVGLAAGAVAFGVLADAAVSYGEKTREAAESTRKFVDEMKSAIVSAAEAANKAESEVVNFGKASSVVRQEAAYADQLAAQERIKFGEQLSIQAAKEVLEAEKALDRRFENYKIEEKLEKQRLERVLLAAKQNQQRVDSALAVAIADEDSARRTVEALEKIIAKLRQVKGEWRSAGPSVDAELRNRRELEGKTEVTAAEFEASLRRSRRSGRSSTPSSAKKKADEERIIIEEETTAFERQIAEDMRSTRARDDADRQAEEQRQRDIKIQRESEMNATIAKNEREWADAEAQYEREVQAALREERLRGNQMIVDAMKSALMEYVDLSQSVILSSFDMMTTAVEDMAAGQEVSFAALAAGFVKSVGRQLFAIGLKQTFEGGGYILSGAASGDARAIAAGIGLVSMGTTAMTVGGGMAVSGAIASGMVARSESGAASGGGSSGSSVGRSPGRQRLGNGEGGDGMSVTYVLVGGTILGDPGDGMRRLEQRRRRELRSVHTPGMA